MPVFANGRGTGKHAFDGNESADESSNDDETPIDMGDTSEEILTEMAANEGGGNTAQKKRASSASASTEGGPSKKQKKGQLVDDRILEATTEIILLRPLIKQLVDTIARALGESEDHNNKRQELLKKLEELGHLTRMEILTALRKLSQNDRDLMTFYGLDNNEDQLMFVKMLIDE